MYGKRSIESVLQFPYIVNVGNIIYIGGNATAVREKLE
jgi:hypothetical protein